MSGHECYHCKQWVEEGEAHDCWTTTEAALTADLSEDLQEAWERIRETATAFGDQRVYASHRSIMFSRGSSVQQRGPNDISRPALRCRRRRMPAFAAREPAYPTPTGWRSSAFALSPPRP